MSKYKILVVGRGKRGMHHATTFNANPKFQVTGICNVDMVRLDAAAAKLGNPEKGTDATALARKLKPDVFCFCTLPNLRIPMIKGRPRKPPEPLRQALPEGEGDHCWRRAGSRPYRLWQRHRLDDAHAVAPD